MNTNRHTVRDRAKHDEQKRDMGANQMKIRYATFEINGEKRISFNRNELLSILLSMDSNDKKNGKIEKFIEKLEEILIEEQK